METDCRKRFELLIFIQIQALYSEFIITIAYYHFRLNLYQIETVNFFGN